MDRFTYFSNKFLTRNENYLKYSTFQNMVHSFFFTLFLFKKKYFKKLMIKQIDSLSTNDLHSQVAVKNNLSKNRNLNEMKINDFFSNFNGNNNKIYFPINENVKLNLNLTKNNFNGIKKDEDLNDKFIYDENKSFYEMNENLSKNEVFKFSVMFFVEVLGLISFVTFLSQKIK